MKAIRVARFGGPEVLELQEVPDPVAGPGQVVVLIKAIGVNPVETYIRTGTYARKPALPYTPGADGAGIVESVGTGVKKVKAGSRVYVAGSPSGTYAEKALCLESQVHPIDERVSFAQGAAVNIPYATAYRGLFHRAEARPGESVLVHGASGGVGVAAVQIANASGMRVIGTAGTDRGLELVMREGAHMAFNHRSEDYLDRIREYTGQGPDVILEMLANVNLAKDLKLVAPKGRIVVIGSRGPTEIDARDGMGKDASILPMSLSNASEAELASIHAWLVAGLANGTLCPVTGQEMPLDDAARAHEAVMEPGAYGKIVLIPG